MRFGVINSNELYEGSVRVFVVDGTHPITGNIVVNTAATWGMAHIADNQAMYFSGGTTYEHGASVQLYGEDEGTYPGNLYLVSGGATVSPTSIVEIAYRDNASGYQSIATFDSTLMSTFHGGMEWNVTTVNAATYSVVATDHILHITYSNTNPCTVTIPAAQLSAGRVLIFKDSDGNAGTNNVTIDTGGAETIDGAATYVMNTDYESVTMFSSGSHWYVI